jgi:hypothetical protein
MSLRGFRFYGFIRIIALFKHFEFERKVSLSNFMSFHKNCEENHKTAFYISETRSSRKREILF